MLQTQTNWFVANKMRIILYYMSDVREEDYFLIKLLCQEKSIQRIIMSSKFTIHILLLIIKAIFSITAKGKGEREFTKTFIECLIF